MRNDTPGSGFSYCILSWSGLLEYYTSFVKISAKRMPDFFLYIEHPVAKDALPHVDRHSILAIFRELFFFLFRASNQSMYSCRVSLDASVSMHSGNRFLPPIVRSRTPRSSRVV